MPEDFWQLTSYLCAQASLGLRRNQAESIALAAQSFQNDSQQLQRQRSQCLVALKQASWHPVHALLAPRLVLTTLSSRSASLGPFSVSCHAATGSGVGHVVQGYDRESQTGTDCSAGLTSLEKRLLHLREVEQQQYIQLLSAVLGRTVGFAGRLVQLPVLL